MSYRTIVLLLLFIFLQFEVFSQTDSLNIVSDTTLYQASKQELLQFQIDSIITDAIHAEAFPGCVIHVIHQGGVLFSKPYGHHTYDSTRKVQISNLYDLASISKPTGAVLAMMKLYEMNLLALDQPIKTYVNGFNWNKRGNVTIREVLTHQSGFQGWIKYYEKIRNGNGKYRNRTISEEFSEDYPFKVSEDKFLHKDFYQDLKKYIKRAGFTKEKKYRYSDLFFYLVPEIVKNRSGMEYSDFLNYHFYDSLEVESLVFNPLDIYPMNEIVPTEIDTFFRMEPIHGTVHDEGAILMQGISGHAGLFANANDLGSVWQMLLNGGKYGKKKYLEPSTVELFTSYQFPANGNRRALGFDKPLLAYDPVISSIAEEASVYSFGHTGFTGSLIWADPENDFLFIFLSNRVYPDRGHKAIYQLNVRPTIHEIFYKYLQELPDESQKK